MRDMLSKTKIYAPFTGVVDEIIANQGSNLIPGVTNILRLVNLDDVYAEAFVSEKYISSISNGTEALVKIPLLNKEIQSEVTQTGNFIDPNNRTFRIEIPVDNTDRRIKQNLDAKILINTYKKDNAVVVPLRIIREDAEGKNYIYVMDEDKKDGVYITRKALIKIGNKSNTDAEVIEGLNFGEIIVLEGANLVEDLQRVKLIN